MFEKAIWNHFFIYLNLHMSVFVIYKYLQMWFKRSCWAKRNLSTRHENPLFKLLASGVQETPQGMLLFLVASQRLLMTPCTWDTGPGGPQLDLT